MSRLSMEAYERFPTPHMRDGVINYIEHHIPPGGFLTAVLENDLFQAFARADLENRESMFYICAWFNSYAPAGCYGSPEAVKNWLSQREPSSAA